MDDATLRAAEQALSYSFADPALLALALTHASVADARLESNERLEFLGDAVLGMISCERIYTLFPDLLEGDMTKIKSATVSRRTCADIARELGIDELLSIGKGMQGQYELPNSLAAAVLESVLGAIYLDGGYEAAREFAIPLLDPLIEAAAECGHQQNFKSVLQQHLQQSEGSTPSYRVLDEKGPDHAKCFKVVVELGDHRFEPAWGQSKKQAEQQAALNALHELGVVEEDDEGMVRVMDNGREAIEEEVELPVEE